MSVAALAIRQKKAVQEREVLKCPKCYCRMEPLMLDTDERGFQNIWWMCRNSREKKCDFPLDMPADIYWVKRSPLQVKDGFIPHPEIKLLPQKYRYLYPSIFPNESRTPDSRCTSVLSRDSTETNSSGGSLHTRDMSLGSILPSPIPLSESSNMERHELSPSIMASSLSTPHYSNTDSGSMSSGGAGPTTALDDLDVDIDDLTSVPYCTRKRPSSSGEEGNSMSESIWNQICSMNVDPRILEDDQLMDMMAGVINKIQGGVFQQKRSKINMEDYLLSVEHLFQLDFKPFKRRIATDTTSALNAVYALRNARDAESMLSAIGATTIYGRHRNTAEAIDLRDALHHRIQEFLRTLASRRINSSNSAFAKRAKISNKESDSDASPNSSLGIKNVETECVVNPCESKATKAAKKAQAMEDEHKMKALVKVKVQSQLEASAARRRARRLHPEKVNIESSSWYSEGSSQMGLDVPSLHYDPTTFECPEGEQSIASCSALPYSNGISNAASTADTFPVDIVHQNVNSNEQLFDMDELAFDIFDNDF